jgi:hypothetical protein
MELDINKRYSVSRERRKRAAKVDRCRARVAEQPGGLRLKAI